LNEINFSTGTNKNHYKWQLWLLEVFGN